MNRSQQPGRIIFYDPRPPPPEIHFASAGGTHSSVNASDSTSADRASGGEGEGEGTEDGESRGCVSDVIRSSADGDAGGGAGGGADEQIGSAVVEWVSEGPLPARPQAHRPTVDHVPMNELCGAALEIALKCEMKLKGIRSALPPLSDLLATRRGRAAAQVGGLRVNNNLTVGRCAKNRTQVLRRLYHRAAEAIRQVVDDTDEAMSQTHGCVFPTDDLDAVAFIYSSRPYLPSRRALPPAKVVHTPLPRLPRVLQFAEG